MAFLDPFTIFIMFLLFILIGAFGLGCHISNDNKYYVHTNITTNFDDIVGCESTIEEIKETLVIFQNRDKFTELKTEITKGFIFTGPNGTGKTLMAKAIAGEYNIPFIEININDPYKKPLEIIIDSIIEKYKKCIIFCDEADNYISNKNGQLLKFIDGLRKYPNIIIILACNLELNKIDSGIIRSGRLDKIIKFNKPNIEERMKHLKKLKFELSEYDIIELSKETSDMTHADINVIAREIKILDVLKPQNIRNVNEYKTIIRRIKNGIDSSIPSISLYDKKRLCYHEVGHLITQIMLKNIQNPNCISIQKFTHNTIVIFGFVDSYCDNDTKLMTEKNYLAWICIHLASSIFEKHYLGDYANSCNDDFFKIDYFFGKMNDSRMLDDLQYMYKNNKEEEVKIKNNIIKKCIVVIRQIIIQNNDTIEKIVDILFEKEIIYHQELSELIDKKLYNSIEINL